MIPAGTRWIDTLDPADLSVSVPGGLLVQVMHPQTMTWQERPVRCPWCQNTTGLHLRTAARDATLLCEQGHAWTDTAVLTAAVRQLHALDRQSRLTTAPVRVPRTENGVWLWLVPRRQPLGSGGPDLPEAEPGPGTSSVLCGAERLPDMLVRDPSLPLTLRWARYTWGLLAWTIPHDGTLYEHLAHGPGSGPDPRTVGLALWLLLNDTAATASVPAEKWATQDLADLAARLNPDDSSTFALRDRLRAPEDPELWDVLTETDTAILRACSDQEWVKACSLAHLVLLVQLHHARISRAYTAGLRIDPPFLRSRLLDCYAVQPVAG